MTIDKVRDFFGIRYLIPYDITTKKPIVVLRAVGEISYENQQERQDLNGGHSEAPWDVEFGQPTPALTGTVREYPPELFKLLETYTITENSAETSGNIGTITNHQGTSVYDASNGVSNITVNPSTKTNLKLGRYVLVATAAQTLDIHVAGLVDEFDNIEGRAVASVDCSSAGSVQVDALGIVLTVTGTAAFTTGDTAAVDVRPVNTGSVQVLVGAGATPANFGLMCVFPRKSDGVLHLIDIFKVSARGQPWKGVSREWSEFEINWAPLARESDGAVYEMLRVFGS